MYTRDWLPPSITQRSRPRYAAGKTRLFKGFYRIRLKNRRFARLGKINTHSARTVGNTCCCSVKRRRDVGNMTPRHPPKHLFHARLWRAPFRATSIQLDVNGLADIARQVLWCLPNQEQRGDTWGAGKQLNPLQPPRPTAPDDARRNHHYAQPRRYPWEPH